MVVQCTHFYAWTRMHGMMVVINLSGSVRYFDL